MEIGLPTGKCLLAEGNKEVDFKWTIERNGFESFKIEVIVLQSAYSF